MHAASVHSPKYFPLNIAFKGIFCYSGRQAQNRHALLEISFRHPQTSRPAQLAPSGWPRACSDLALRPRLAQWLSPFGSAAGATPDG